MSKYRIYLGLIFISSYLACPLALSLEETLNLPQKQISMCGKTYQAWVADTEGNREKGLMNFRPLKSNEAMLFIFDDIKPRSFWMKNVPFDLDIAFFNHRNILVSFTRMKGTSPLTRDEAQAAYSSAGSAKFAVEVAGGSLTSIPRGCKLKF